MTSESPIWQTEFGDGALVACAIHDGHDVRAEVSDCLRLMTEHRVRHLPVLENEQLVGIVSIGDLVNWVISAQSATIDNLEGYISGRYPG